MHESKSCRQTAPEAVKNMRRMMAAYGATIALIGAGVSAAASAGSAGVAAAQQSANARAQSQAAANQATIAQQQAKTDLQIGAANEGGQRLRNVQVEGTQLAAISQSNTGVTSGSAQDVMRQTAIQDSLAALSIRYEGQLNAHGESVQAQEAQTYSTYESANARNALYGGYLGAGSALLSTGSSYATSNLPGGTGPGFPSWF